MPPTQRTVSNAVSTQPQGNGVAVRDEGLARAREMVERYAPSFERVLPSHVGRMQFVALLKALLQRSPDLREAAHDAPDSLIHAAMDCATLGHLPGRNYAFTVRRVFDKETRQKIATVVGIEEYTGAIERMYRAGAVAAIKAEVVRENDTFVWSPTRMTVPVHEFDAMASDAKRGGLRGVYAYAEMDSGAISRVVVMNADEVMRHKAKATNPDFVWNGPFEPAMWLKTALLQLEKFVPTSSEYLRQRIEAEAERGRVEGTLTSPSPVDYTRPDAPPPPALGNAPDGRDAGPDDDTGMGEESDAAAQWADAKVRAPGGGA